MKKKHLSLLIILFFVGTIIYNLIVIDYQAALFSESNTASIIGLCAGVCGLILGYTMYRFHVIKEKIEKMKK